MIKPGRRQEEFFARVKEILWESWDPIGVNDGENEWCDEDDRYAPHIYATYSTAFRLQRVS